MLASLASRPLAAFPVTNGGSASALRVSRPARRSLALWPVWSLSRPRRPFFIGVLQTILLPPPSAPTASGWSDSCRAGFAPAEALPSAPGDVWLARSRRYGDIRRTLLAIPAVPDADRSRPLPQNNPMKCRPSSTRIAATFEGHGDPPDFRDDDTRMGLIWGTASASPYARDPRRMIGPFLTDSGQSDQALGCSRAGLPGCARADVVRRGESSRWRSGSGALGGPAPAAAACCSRRGEVAGAPRLPRQRVTLTIPCC